MVWKKLVIRLVTRSISTGLLVLLLKASLAKILNVEADHVLAEQALMGYRERFAVKGLYENHVFEGVAEH